LQYKPGTVAGLVFETAMEVSLVTHPWCSRARSAIE
jgi:hypothetical protein